MTKSSYTTLGNLGNETIMQLRLEFEESLRSEATNISGPKQARKPYLLNSGFPFPLDHTEMPFPELSR